MVECLEFKLILKGLDSTSHSSSWGDYGQCPLSLSSALFGWTIIWFCEEPWGFIVGHGQLTSRRQELRHSPVPVFQAWAQERQCEGRRQCQRRRCQRPKCQQHLSGAPEQLFQRQTHPNAQTSWRRASQPELWLMRKKYACVFSKQLKVRGASRRLWDVLVKRPGIHSPKPQHCSLEFKIGYECAWCQER